MLSFQDGYKASGKWAVLRFSNNFSTICPRYCLGSINKYISKSRLPLEGDSEGKEGNEIYLWSYHGVEV
jgi:hypothetical protein